MLCPEGTQCGICNPHMDMLQLAKNGLGIELVRAPYTLRGERPDRDRKRGAGMT